MNDCGNCLPPQRELEMHAFGFLPCGRRLEKLATEGLSMRMRLLTGMWVRFSRSRKPTVALTQVARDGVDHR